MFIEDEKKLQKMHDDVSKTYWEILNIVENYSGEKIINEKHNKQEEDFDLSELLQAMFALNRATRALDKFQFYYANVKDIEK